MLKMVAQADLEVPQQILRLAADLLYEAAQAAALVVIIPPFQQLRQEVLVVHQAHT